MVKWLGGFSFLRRSRRIEYRRRIVLAYRLVIGSLTPRDVSELFARLEYKTETYRLVVLTIDEVHAAALERWLPHPELRRLCRDAIIKISSDWEDHTHVKANAVDFGVYVVDDLAASAAILLQETDEWRTPNATIRFIPMADFGGRGAPIPAEGEAEWRDWVDPSRAPDERTPSYEGLRFSPRSPRWVREWPGRFSLSVEVDQDASSNLP